MELRSSAKNAQWDKCRSATHFFALAIGFAALVLTGADAEAKTRCYAAYGTATFATRSTLTGASTQGVTCSKANIVASSFDLTYTSANKFPVALVANGTDAQLSAYASTMNNENSSFTIFVPSTDGTNTLASFPNNTYFLCSEPATQMLALLSYALREINPLMIGFVYSTLTGNSASADAYNQFSIRMTALSLKTPIVTYIVGNTAPNNDGAYNAFRKSLRKSERSCVFLFSPSSANTLAVFEKIITDNDLSTTVLVPSWLMTLVMSHYTNLSQKGTPNLKAPSYVVLSSNNPHPQDSRWAAMSQFASDVGESTLSTYGTNSATGVQAVAGWMAGKLAGMTIQSYNLLYKYVLQTEYQASLYAQPRYTIGDDLLLGAFTSACNVGGRMVLVHTLTSMHDGPDGVYYGLRTLPDADLLLKPTECRATDVQLDVSRLVQVGLLGYTPATSSAGHYLYDQSMKGVQANTAASFNVRSLAVSGSGDVAAAHAVAAQPIAALTGPIPMALQNTAASTALLVDPIFMDTTL